MTETLKEELARLAAKATDEDIEPGGEYFDDSCADLTQCRHGETGRYSTVADGQLIAVLWNAYRAGKLVVKE